MPPADGCRACAKSFGRTRQACLYHAIGFAVAEVAALEARLRTYIRPPIASGTKGGEQ
ncbi:hypothetical protein JYJ95_06730 [Corallococcus exiguus]|uniref:hypothetical protein n=1 Tax=Corallococcus exiguus TaxID=83462 RepID=UPI001A8D0FC3|nr:hypothetical protein [Corallococcus exiguus]MBN8466200.1 hypothetical protein [Corallococcus exiguus]